MKLLKNLFPLQLNGALCQIRENLQPGRIRSHLLMYLRLHAKRVIKEMLKETSPNFHTFRGCSALESQVSMSHMSKVPKRPDLWGEKEGQLCLGGFQKCCAESRNCYEFLRIISKEMFMYWTKIE